MSTLAYFFKNSSLRLIVYGIGIMSAFIVTPHILHAMGSTIYGVWVLIASLTPYYSVFNFATSNSISTLYAKAHNENDETLMQQVLVAAIQFGFVSILSTLLISFLYFLIADSDFSQHVNTASFALALFIYAFNFGVFSLINFSHGFLAGEMKWNTIAFTSMLRVIFSSIGALLFLDSSYSSGENLIRMACISSANFLFESIINFALAKKYMPPMPPLKAFFTNPFHSKLFGISRGLSISLVGTLLRQSTQVYLIGAFLSISAVTFYSFTRQILAYMSDLLLSAFGILGPYFSKLSSQNDIHSTQNTLMSSTFLSYGISSIISLGLIFYGDLFFIRWVGDDFANIQILLTPMALAALFDSGSLPLNSFLIGVQKQNILAKISVIEGVIISALTVPVLLMYGLAGVGWIVFFSSLYFRMIQLTMNVCIIAKLSLRSYYMNLALALVPAGVVQCLYYSFVQEYVVATYPSILLAGFGQGIVACATLLIVAKLFLPKGK